MDLIIHNKNKQIFKEEILRELPSAICYKHQFKDIVCKDNMLIITKDLIDSPPLIQLSIKDIMTGEEIQTCP